MEVILLEKMRNLGSLGDKVRVKNGFGRNYLIPNHKAVPATEANIAKFEARRAELEQKAQTVLEQAKERADKLNALNISIEAMASDEGKLYGSVGTNEIVTAVTEAGVELEKKEVLLPEGALHYVGEYQIDIQVHTDVTAQIKLAIVAAK